LIVKSVLGQYLLLSFLAGLFLIILVIVHSSSSVPVSSVDKIGITIFFIACCIVGISFALRPNWRKHWLRKKGQTLKNKPDTLARKYKGHHPDCDKFQDHTILFQQTTWCTGCLGLSIGSICAILFMLMYGLSSYQQPVLVSKLIILLGLATIGLVYLESINTKQQKIIHLFSNAMLIVSFFLITMGLVELTGTIVYGLFSLLLCVLWLETRIQLSKRQHERICKLCTASCKIYRLTS